jgi:S1-C subfamily serine protease
MKMLVVGALALASVLAVGTLYVPSSGFLPGYAVTAPSMQADILNATVRVEVGQGSGSGTFLDRKHLLTNHHVIEGSLNRGGRVEVRGWIVEDGRLFPVTYPGMVIVSDEKLDLAIVRIIGEWVGSTAQIADHEPAQGENVIKAGAAHGDRVKVTSGWWQFVYEHPQLGDVAHHSAPSIGGDSGGGVWALTPDGYRLVAVTRAIQGSHGAPISTSALAIPLAALRAFIEGALDANASLD